MERFQTFVICHEDKIPLIPLWHGTSEEAGKNIAANGYATLGLTDPGFFGRGCFYGTPQSEYACRVYGKNVVTLNIVSIGNVFPVIFKDMVNLLGQCSYKNYDCHYAPVIPKNKNSPNGVDYVAIKDLAENPMYDEFVIFQEGQVVPRFIVYYEKV